MRVTSLIYIYELLKADAEEQQRLTDKAMKEYHEALDNEKENADELKDVYCRSRNNCSAADEAFYDFKTHEWN